MGPDRGERGSEAATDRGRATVPDGGESGGGNDGRRATWDRSDPETIPSTVVRTVAAVTETDPLEMSQPLHGVVDADALVSLLSSGPGDGTVSIRFELTGQLVTVADDGSITVRPSESDDA